MVGAMNTAKPLGPMVPIRELRMAHGLSIEQTCERIEVYLGKKPHGDTLRNIELGHRKASQPLLNAWAKALGLIPLDVQQSGATLRDEELVRP